MTQANLPPALPFWCSLLLLPLIAAAAVFGTPMIVAVFAYTLLAVSLIDLLAKTPAQDPDPETETARLFWHRLVTLIWLPLQILAVYGTIWWVTVTDHLSRGEIGFLMVALGMITGGIGIVYAHELMHQRNRLERGLGEALMISVLYGHFVTEHLAVHHRYVGTPRDAATARYNESIYRFLPRVLFGSLRSAWQVEAGRLHQKRRATLHISNPFWRYFGGAAICLLLAWAIGGRFAVGLYLLQAGVAVLYLELINYIEHYGLTRKRDENGKYEPVAPHHSWNADHVASNFLLINLQRHSDHHVKPSRRFPLLQTYGTDQAPRLPVGYPLLVIMCYNPWLWRRMMNPRVRKWRSVYYPEITDWTDQRGA